MNKKPSESTELVRNIGDLRRYSRQQRQEITNRLRKAAHESSDKAFLRAAQELRTWIHDGSSLA